MDCPTCRKPMIERYEKVNVSGTPYLYEDKRCPNCNVSDRPHKRYRLLEHRELEAQRSKIKDQDPITKEGKAILMQLGVVQDGLRTSLKKR